MSPPHAGLSLCEYPLESNSFNSADAGLSKYWYHCNTRTPTPRAVSPFVTGEMLSQY
jgi:hypothetical protein